jgi:hypothetical protein
LLSPFLDWFGLAGFVTGFSVVGLDFPAHVAIPTVLQSRRLEMWGVLDGSTEAV